MTELAMIQGIVRQEILGAYATGSRVYGTAGPASDEDFLVIVEGARSDLLFRRGVDLVVQGIELFQGNLGAQNMFALEAWFLPDPLRRAPVRWRLDRAKLAVAASQKSAADFAKAKAMIEAGDPAGLKKLFHAVRVPTFARQIARTGRLTDYAEANPFWAEIGEDRDLRRWNERRLAICAEIR